MHCNVPFDQDVAPDQSATGLLTPSGAWDSAWSKSCAWNAGNSRDDEAHSSNS